MSTVPYYPTPGSPGQMTGFPPPVQMAVAGPAPQQRVTVFFRVFMVLPHLVVLYFLSIAAAVVAFIGWWGALFTGQLPDFAQNYLVGYIRWYTRVNAYYMLLTDVYPPFSFDDEPGYPVRMEVPPRERLNRLAVFFRFILAIPAQLLCAVLLVGGFTIIGFVAWLITVISGKLPDGLYQAYTAVLRYNLRTNCYYYLLTPTYPGGLFGDGPSTPASTPPPVADFGAPAGGDVPGYGAPGGYEPAAPGYESAAPGYGAPGGYEPTPPAYDAPGGYEPTAPAYGTPGGYGAPGGYGVPGDYGTAQPSWQPQDWRLYLTSGARQLVGWFIGLGAVFYVAYIVLIVILVAVVRPVSTAQTIDTVSNAHTKLANQLSAWEGTQQSCSDLKCVESGDIKAANYFTSFASTLRSTPMPTSDSSAAAASLYNDASKASQELLQLSQATSVAQYQSDFTSSGFQQTLNQFDQDYNALGTALNAS